MRLVLFLSIVLIRNHARVFLLILSAHFTQQNFAQQDIKLRSVEGMLANSREDALIHRKFIYGFQVGINVTYGERNNGQLRLCISGGMARAIDVNRPVNKVHEKLENTGSSYVAPPLMLVFQPELLIFRGGLGSSLMVGEREKIRAELRNSFAVLAGFTNVRSDGTFSKSKSYGRPISKLEANSQAALYDPYGISVTLGTTFISGLGKTNPVQQQVGNFNFGLGPLQLDYSNDGPFFETKLAQGDAYDRWWTGGGHVGVYLPSDHALITEIVLRYDKFTGFQQNAYEVARQLRLDYIPYLDKREAFKNQGGYNLTIGFENNMYFGMNLFEVGRIDMQNLIHTGMGMPLHQPQLKSRYSAVYGYRVFNSNAIH